MFRPGERAKFESFLFFIALAFRFPICRHVDLILAPCWLHCGAPGPHMASILWGGGWAQFRFHVGAKIGAATSHFGVRAGAGRAGGAARSVKPYTKD